jgi:hypothetical protein
MRNKAILFSSFLLVSSSVFAEQGLLKEVAKQAAKNTATAVAPNAVKEVESANQTLENAKSLKKGVENAPDAVKDQSAETLKALVKKKIDQATPEQTQKAVELLKAGKEKVENTPKTIKNKAKEKALGKALDLLR